MPRKKLMLRYGPVKVGCRIHAEYDCLYNLITATRFNGGSSLRRKKLDIYVARENLLNSKPCFHCIQVLRHFGIKRVYYSMKEHVVKRDVKNIDINLIIYTCEKISEITTEHIAHGNKFYLSKYLSRQQ